MRGGAEKAGAPGPWPFPHDSTSPALINPAREPGEEGVAARVVLACTRPDVELLSRTVQARKPRYLWNCAVRSGFWEEKGITVAGPVLGAPYAAMVLEKLIALGARAVVVLGWCGSLQAHVPSGALVLPVAALPGDGVSPHYHRDATPLEPHPGLHACLARSLSATLDRAIPLEPGLVWTTDAFYRETAAAVGHYQGQGVLAVDLEMAALFAVGRFRGVAVAGLLAVADELFRLTWRPGRGSGLLRPVRAAAASATLAALSAWGDDDA